MAQDIQDLKNILLPLTKSDWEVINSNSSTNRNRTPYGTNTNPGSTVSKERQDIRDTLLPLSKEDWKLIDSNCARRERNQTTASAEETTSGLVRTNTFTFSKFDNPDRFLNLNDAPSIPKKRILQSAKIYRKAPSPSSRLYGMKTQPIKNQAKKIKLTSNVLPILNEMADKEKSHVSKKLFTECYRSSTIKNVRQINESPLIDMKKADDLIKTKSFLKCDLFKKPLDVDHSKFVVTVPEDPALLSPSRSGSTPTKSTLNDSDREFVLLEKQNSSKLDEISRLLSQYQEDENRHLANQREKINRIRDLLYSPSNNPHTIATSSLVTPFGEKKGTPRSIKTADLRKKLLTKLQENKNTAKYNTTIRIIKDLQNDFNILSTPKTRKNANRNGNRIDSKLTEQCLKLLETPQR